MIPVTATLRQKCPACGGSIKFRSWETCNGYESMISAECHGSFEKRAFVVEGFDDERSVRAKVSDWAKGLFSTDRNPDVMELLKANRDGGGYWACS